jgi:hypothetical protein
MRRRSVSGGFEEDEIENHGKEPVELEVKLDVVRLRQISFEVKAGQGRSAHRNVEDGTITLRLPARQLRRNRHQG